MSGSEQSEDETEQCEGFGCTNPAVYVFYDDIGAETRMCEDHSKEFPEDMLEPIEVAA